MKIFYDIIMMDVCHYTFVQTHRMYINHQAWTLRKTTDFGWLWCVQVGSSLVKTVPILVSDADNYGVYVCVGTGYMGNFCTLLSICHKTKTSLKKVLMKKWYAKIKHLKSQIALIILIIVNQRENTLFYFIFI